VLTGFTACRFECEYGSKRFLRGKFRKWYAKQVCYQLDGQNAVDLMLSILKLLGAAWINSICMHACMRASPNLVIDLIN